MVGVMEYGLLIIGAALGTVIGWVLGQQRASGDLIRAEERIRASEEAVSTNEQRVRAEVENIARKIGEDNSAWFLEFAQQKLEANQKDAEHALQARKTEVENLVKPLQEQMERLVKMNHDIEEKRSGAYEGIKRHLKDLGEQTQSLSSRTIALSTALTTSAQARGNWGEVKLRRLFEMAGLSEHVDFFEQVTLENGSRPDFIVRLPQDGVIPIDSKASGSHFLQAAELEPGPEQQALLTKHAQAVKQRIKELSAKAYQDSIEGEFDHVIIVHSERSHGGRSIFPRP